MSIKGFILFFISLVPVPVSTFATHLRGGEITIRQIQCNDYEITLSLYTNLNTQVVAGSGTLRFGDGTSFTLPDLVNETIDAKLGVGRATFKIIHHYTDGTYSISYSEPSRDAGILNIPNSVVVNFFVETSLVVRSDARCNNPVTFKVLPIDRACRGIIFFHNPGASDIDGDSLSFELILPKRDNSAPVEGYVFPGDNKFYTSQDFQKSNESKNGPPIFEISPTTGDLRWDAPGTTGEYVVALKVTEWRKIENVWTQLGYVCRDMQIIVEDCQNTRPFLTIPVDVCVTPGTKISERIRGFDKEFDAVKIEVFFLDSFSNSLPKVGNVNLTQSTKSPYDTANVSVDWTIACVQVRDQPYRIIFKITDDPPNGIRLATFKTWSITVVGNAPAFKSEQLDLAAKSLKLEWNTYECSNASTMEVWRKIGKDNITLGECIRGVPRAYGYEKIAIVSDSEFFIDTDINPGASYCYRLVSLFQSPSKSQSRASLPFCFGPVKVDAPAMTNVSVNSTDTTNGEILVRWTSPFQIDRSQFPPPYAYDVYRTSTGNNFIKLTSSPVKDTVWVDQELNTMDNEYGYKVVVYSPGGLTKENPVDTSAVAFYPRLTYEPRSKGIYLAWNARVPWSNQSERFPYHFIYRREYQALSYVLIDSIRVDEVKVVNGFDYLDEGHYEDLPLTDNTVYQYKISTHGTYDNPKIPEPLINLSNEVLAQPIDKSSPCKPVLTVSHMGCEDFISASPCSVDEYKNFLQWSYPDSCGNDVQFFKINYQGAPDEALSTIQQLSAFAFTHLKKNSFAGCYQVIAVDRSGNESEPSDVICVDNCPNIFIPNVLTANGDGFNDEFPGFIADAGKEQSKCPRFVKSMSLKIYNRWGKEVYVFEKNENDLSDEWKGLDSKGNELSTGVYFYVAEVTFTVLDASSEKQKSKGWVNLIR